MAMKSSARYASSLQRQPVIWVIGNVQETSYMPVTQWRLRDKEVSIDTDLIFVDE
jgi:hypothetical protein